MRLAASHDATGSVGVNLCGAFFFFPPAGFYAVASIGRVERTASTGAILSVPALGDKVLRVDRITAAVDTLQRRLSLPRDGWRAK